MNIDRREANHHLGPMGKRADEKIRTKERIIQAASTLIRERGIAGLKVADVMAAASLTHGAFYAHFADKDELIEAAFHKALDHREAWFSAAAKQPPKDRLEHLAQTYLTDLHRDAPQNGCAFASLARDFAQAGGPFPKLFEAELNVSLNRLTKLLVSNAPEDDRQRAMGLLSLCVGGMVLARAVDDPTLSNNLLKAAAAFGATAGSPETKT
ncbi:MAG: TetR family transcriptional regulator [Rhodobiaceae bacterium]|nr:MAG: TetR family transcriptional regulator [Rhodobiaceae bacterium]